MSNNKRLFQEWQNNKEEKAKENFAFLKQLKFREDIEDLNKTIDALNDEVFEEINCLDCGNCCKTFNITLTKEDCKRISQFLGKDIFSVVEYTITPEEEVLIETLPCPFLGKDNACTIYEVRPEVCQDFPYFKGKNIRQRPYQYSHNTEICPATYHILERLKKIIL